MDRVVSNTHNNARRPMPSPIDTPASPAATPMEKGFTVAPITPLNAPRMIIDAVTMRS